MEIGGFAPPTFHLSPPSSSSARTLQEGWGMCVCVHVCVRWQGWMRSALGPIADRSWVGFEGGFGTWGQFKTGLRAEYECILGWN